MKQSSKQEKNCFARNQIQRLPFTLHTGQSYQYIFSRSQEATGFNQNALYVLFVPKEYLILYLDTFPTPMQNLKDKNQILVCCLAVLFLPSAAALGSLEHLNPFIFHLFLAFLKQFYCTPEGFASLSQRGEKNSKTCMMHQRLCRQARRINRFKSPGTQVSASGALRHELGWLSFGCKIKIQEDLCLRVYFVEGKLTLHRGDEAQDATKKWERRRNQIGGRVNSGA